MRHRFIFAGVGGQGVLFATRLFTYYAVDRGYNAISSETHGMAQRGGSVVSHLKVGEFSSPMIRKGNADYLLALEAVEAYRYLHFLRDGAVCFLNAADPDFLDAKVAEVLRARNIAVWTVDANAIAAGIGAPKATNLVHAGFTLASGLTGIDKEPFRETVERVSPERFRTMNMAAFEAGVAAWKAEA